MCHIFSILLDFSWHSLLITHHQYPHEVGYSHCNSQECISIRGYMVCFFTHFVLRTIHLQISLCWSNQVFVWCEPFGYYRFVRQASCKFEVSTILLQADEWDRSPVFSEVRPKGRQIRQTNRVCLFVIISVALFHESYGYQWLWKNVFLFSVWLKTTEKFCRLPS